MTRNFLAGFVLAAALAAASISWGGNAQGESPLPGTANYTSTAEANTAVAASPNVLATSESNSIFTNEGTAAENHHDLPAAAAGLRYIFIVQDANGMQINAASGDTIQLSSSVSGAAGDISTTTVGSSVTLVAINATEWVATEITGSWVVN